MNDNFAVFILSHGRAHLVKTYEVLRRQGYTGPIYIICDNKDGQLRDYKRMYGDQVIVFDKDVAMRDTDVADNLRDHRGVVYARNVSFKIASDLGLDYFLQLDDDYYAFEHIFSPRFVYYRTGKPVKNLDNVFEAMLEFYKSVPSMLSLAMGQGGDLVGGYQSNSVKRVWLKRKAMNSFLCSVHRPFRFTGRINEDVTAYVTLGHRGGLFFTFYSVVLRQNHTQHRAGGLTELYLDLGTYVKSFYSVMHTPSCVKIDVFAHQVDRPHHIINWNTAVPKILHERYCKRLVSSPDHTEDDETSARHAREKRVSGD